MKYSVLLTAVALFVSLVVSETLRNDETFSYLSEGGIRQRRSPASPAAQPPVEHINYRPYSQVPSNIKQLLEFQQAREPITHIAAQSPPQLAKAPSPSKSQYNPQIQHGGQSQIQSNPQYQPQPQAAYQPQQSPQYQQHPQQAQAAYNPQQYQHGNQQQQIPGIVFRPDQRRLY